METGLKMKTDYQQARYLSNCEEYYLQTTSTDSLLRMKQSPSSGTEHTKKYTQQFKVKRKNEENTEDVNIVPITIAKSGAQRAREYRDRKKLNIKRIKQNDINAKSMNIMPKVIAKSGAQRAREYRERKKFNIKSYNWS